MIKKLFLFTNAASKVVEADLDVVKNQLISEEFHLNVMCGPCQLMSLHLHSTHLRSAYLTPSPRPSPTVPLSSKLIFFSQWC